MLDLYVSKGRIYFGWSFIVRPTRHVFCVQLFWKSINDRQRFNILMNENIWSMTSMMIDLGNLSNERYIDEIWNKNDWCRWIHTIKLSWTQMHYLGFTNTGPSVATKVTFRSQNGVALFDMLHCNFDKLVRRSFAILRIDLTCVNSVQFDTYLFTTSYFRNSGVSPVWPLVARRVPFGQSGNIHPVF